MSHRRHPIWKTLVTMAVDLVAIGLGLGLAYWIRFHSGLLEVTKGWSPLDYLRALPWAWGVWFLAFRIGNLYRRRSKVFDFSVVRRVVTRSILALLFLFAIVFYLQQGLEFSRAFTPIVYGCVVLLVLSGRACLSWVLSRLARTRQIGLTRTIIVGHGPLAARVYERLKQRPEHGMAPLGIVRDEDAARPLPEDSSIPVLGSVDDLQAIINEQRVAEVVLTQAELSRERIPGVLACCENNHASFRIVPDAAELLMSGMTVETLDGIPFLGLRTSPLQGWNAALKRVFDFSAALAGLTICSPALALTAWLVRREDGGPVFYRQDRMGIDGRRFRILKFRTMRTDAERESGPIFADENDPRCTRIGAFLRKYRVDELPQLVNVLRGEMSLVGPRPERPYFTDQFRDDVPRYMTRHRVRCGITGWAQINGFSGKRGTIAQRVEYDLYYIENWSLWLDLKILAATLFRVAVMG